MFDKLDKISTAIKTTKEAFYEIGKKELREIIYGLFKKHPELKVITWNQYVPHFNDGAPCVFEVYEVNYTCSQDEADAFAKEKISGYDFEATESLIDEDINNLDNFLHNNKDLAEFIFGEGTVKCTAKLIIVEDCGHD